MDELPARILSRIADDARPVVQRWWAGLTVEDRQVALAAWNEKSQNRFFTPNPVDASEVLPVVIGGRFVPAEQPLIGPEWCADYFEYLLKNPELLLNEKPHFHIGGVCTAHPAARVVLEAGCVPPGFVCPLDSVLCPMRRLLEMSPGRALHLTGPTVLISPTPCPTVPDPDS